MDQEVGGDGGLSLSSNNGDKNDVWGNIIGFQSQPHKKMKLQQLQQHVFVSKKGGNAWAYHGIGEWNEE